ncbi:hypothetical protein [Dokdonia sp.]|uniref:hypothetical protein n=1 Tax=Dokdonia sp. TaxID=2024995 RepID=UPI003266F0DD
MRRLNTNSIGFAALVGRTITKTNRAQRPESKRGVSLVSSRKTETHYKKASPEVLERIKRDMKKKQRRRRVKLLYVSILISTVMLFCLWYLKHFNYI